MILKPLRTRNLLPLLEAAIVFALTAVAVPFPANAQNGEWAFFRGDVLRTGLNATENILQPKFNQLKSRWTALQGDPTAADINVTVEASPVIGGGKVFVATLFDSYFDSGYDSSVVAFDLETGIELWKTAVGTQGVWSTPAFMPTADGRGRLFVAAWDGKVYALDAQNGAIVWETQVAPAIESRSFRASPIIAGSSLFVVPYVYQGSSSLYALDLATGAITASKPLPGSLFGSPSIGNGRLYLPVQLPDTRSSRIEAYSLHPSSFLQQLWSRPLSRDYASTTPIYFDEKIFYRSAVPGDATANYVYIMHAVSGSDYRAPYHLPDDAFYFSSPALDYNKLFVATSAHLYAFDLAQLLSNAPNPIVWSFSPLSLGDEGDFAASPAVANGFLYISTDDNSTISDGAFYALDVNTGAVAWKFTGSNGVGSSQASPAVANGTVVFVSYDENDRLQHGVYAFENICFVLTAVFGDPNATEIQTLRTFHQRYIADGPTHQQFLQWYSKNGPMIARFVENRPILRTLLKAFFSSLAKLASLLL